MFLRVALFVMMAIGLAGLGTVTWITLRPAGHDAAAATVVRPTGPVQILVAAVPLRAGALLKPEDIIVKEIKGADLPDGASPDNGAGRAVLVGAMLKRSLGKEEPLLAHDVIRPTEHGFLAAVVGQGMLAVTIGTDAISGTAGLISPGDRVDVILSQVLEEAGLAAGRRVVAETVLTNARVVAIDQQIIQGEGARAGDGGHGGHTVTLEATSDQAQRLTVAARIGKLSLIVRSADISAAGNGAPSAPVFASDVSRALASQFTKKSTGVMRVYPGSGESREFRF